MFGIGLMLTYARWSSDMSKNRPVSTT